MTTILCCTVGGSHEPIIRAIRETAPDVVCFFCTGRDPATGRPGSDQQIVGKGHVIKAHRDDAKPTLPNIPAQTGLTEDRFEVITVPADDLDGAYALMCAALGALAARYPEARLRADYTGGTKSMTAALVLAALEQDHAELQLVTGARVDLVSVRSGMERVSASHVETIRLRRSMAPYLAAWNRYAYGEAARGLQRLPRPRDPQLAGDLDCACDLSRALDAWDRFEHAGAHRLLDLYRPRIGHALGPQLTLLGKLADNDAAEADVRSALRLLDLRLNAQRRAAQGRFDDAVARLYRLLEWLAQWLLRRHCGLNTSDLDPQTVPEGITLTRNRKGQHQAGLFAAWDLVGARVPDPAAGFVQSQREALRDHIDIRNHSILAHGFTPVDETAWRRMADWAAENVIPLLESEASAVGIKQPLAQLPDRYPLPQ